MKNTLKLLRIIALIALIGFGFTACDDSDGSNGGSSGGSNGGNSDGNSGGNTSGNSGGNNGGNDPVAVYKVTLNKTYLLFNEEGSETLTAVVSPENATNKAVTWTSSDNTVATVSNGTVTAVNEGITTITVTTADGSLKAYCSVSVSSPYDPNPANPVLGYLNVGKIGPGGGQIFYYDQNGFTVTGTGSFIAYYLEASPVSLGSLAWASSEYTRASITTGELIGTGKENTRLILAKDANAPAAKACDEYSNNGKTDWFLPSRNELRQMNSLDILSGSFWSSTQHYDYLNNYFHNAYYHDKRGGGIQPKSDIDIVHAVRAF